MKRYRRPKVVEGQIKFQKGKIDGDVDICIFYGDNVPRCDRALVMNAFCSKRVSVKLEDGKPVFSKSFIDELEDRGYDIDSLRFSIDRKLSHPK